MSDIPSMHISQESREHDFVTLLYVFMNNSVDITHSKEGKKSHYAMEKQYIC